MSIELYVDPEVSGKSWPEFLSYCMRFSAALDGYVNVGPRFDATKMVVNFNHHEEVDRLATRATCAQSLMAIRQGMFSSFRDLSGPQLTVYVNDCDEDVCTSWFLLKHHYMVDRTMNPLLNRLVSMEDALDATAGAYPFPADLPALRELAWIFEPYRQFRLNGGLDKRDASSFHSIIVDVENRIMKHVLGQGDRIALDVRYDVIGGGNGWTMVKEVGAHARTGMFGDGIKAYVSVRERANGKYTYTLGKLSPFIPFDLLKLTAAFNKEDPSVSENEKWGGGNNIMGSPRVSGSSLNPDTLARIIKETL
jgi:hypothetical protein